MKQKSTHFLLYINIIFYIYKRYQSCPESFHCTYMLKGHSCSIRFLVLLVVVVVALYYYYIISSSNFSTFKLKLCPSLYMVSWTILSLYNFVENISGQSPLIPRFSTKSTPNQRIHYYQNFRKKKTSYGASIIVQDSTSFISSQIIIFVAQLLIREDEVFMLQENRW